MEFLEGKSIMGLFSKKIRQDNILICIGKKDNENKLTIPNNRKRFQKD